MLYTFSQFKYSLKNTYKI